MTLFRAFAALAVACLLATGARAAGLEDAWRRFIDSHPQAAAWAAQAMRPAGGEFIGRVEVARRVDALPLGTNEYAVFVTPGCATCDAAVDGLRRTGANVAVLDITRNPTARQAFAATGARGLPATLIGHYLITGWSREAFERAVVMNVQDDMREAQGN